MTSPLIRLVDQSRIWGVTSQIQGDAGSPGSDGASPYQRSGLSALPCLCRHRLYDWSTNRLRNLWGAHRKSRMTCRATFASPSPIVLVLVLDLLMQCMGDDVAGQGDAGNPGSDGASPYQEASPLFPPSVLVLVIVLDLLMQCMGDDVARQDNPVNPGSDGASPYQEASPLFPQSCSLSSSIFLMQCMGDDVAGQDNPGNPGSDGALPYLRRRHPNTPTRPTPTRRHVSPPPPPPYAVTPLRSATVGRHRVNVVPLPGLLAMSIVPE